MKTKMILISLAVAAFTWSAGSAVAAPTSLTYDGAVYTVTDTQVGTQDYKFTLNIDLTGYTGGGSYLNALAFSVNGNSSFSDFFLLSTPDGVSNWNIIPGGLNAQGCDSHGSPWVCIDDTANSGKGYLIPKPLSSDKDIQFMFEFQGVNLTSDGLELKAEYANSAGKKVGSLISAGISPVPVSPVPEPSNYVMLLAGLALIGFVIQRRKHDFIV